MKRAFNLLSTKPDFIYIDGIYCPDIKILPMEAVVRGDSLIKAISAASVIAKVERDKIIALEKQNAREAQQNSKGYPTKEHLQLVKQYGINKIYRLSFKPIKELINKKDT